MSLLVLFCLQVFASVGQGKLLLDSGVGYFSDSVTTSAADNSSKIVYNLGAFFSINKTLWGGWSYMGLTSDLSSSSSNTTFSGTGTGPALKWQFGKGRVFSITAAFNVLSTATYKSGSSTEEWAGTSYNLQLAALPSLGKNWSLGASINYYSASYTTRKVNKLESNVSYSRQLVYPMISLTKEF